MQLKKYRWSRDYESAEEELQQLFSRHHYEPVRWHGSEHQVYGLKTAIQDTKLWCAEGSIFYSVSGQRYSLQPGDALDIPEGADYEAVAGISGCVCYELTL
jgi:hypothetical protein